MQAQVGLLDPLTFLFSGCTVAHVKSVKHTGLASFAHSLDLFVYELYTLHIVLSALGCYRAGSRVCCSVAI